MAPSSTFDGAQARRPADAEARDPSSLAEELHPAVVEVVAGAHDLEPAGAPALGQQLREAQAVDDAAHVLADGGVEQCLALPRRAALGLEHGRDDRLDQWPIRPGKVALRSTTSPRGDRAAALVAQDEDQRHAKLCHGVLDAALRRDIDGVAGVADDEQLAKTPPEQDLRRDAGV